MNGEASPKRRKSEHEFIKKYARSRGGTLVLNYQMVKGDRAKRVQFRWIDAILIVGKPGKLKELSRTELDKRGLKADDEVEFIQAKTTPLGMSLMGQALFSRSLMNETMRRNRWRVKSRHWIALCRKTDDKLGELASDYGIDVVVPQKGKFVVAN